MSSKNKDTYEVIIAMSQHLLKINNWKMLKILLQKRVKHWVQEYNIGPEQQNCGEGACYACSGCRFNSPKLNFSQTYRK